MGRQPPSLSRSLSLALSYCASIVPNKISEISPHFVCNFCQHVSRTTFCSLFSSACTYMVHIHICYYIYMYATLSHLLANTIASHPPAPLPVLSVLSVFCGIFRNPMNDFSRFSSSQFFCIFTRLLCREPVASSQAAIHL